MIKKIPFLVFLFFSCLLFERSVFADDISVTNHTDRPIWAGIYELKCNLIGKSASDGVLFKSIIHIQSNQTAKIEIPPYQFFSSNRELFFSDIEGYLKPIIEYKDYRFVSKISLGLLGALSGSKFHIADEGNVLDGYTDIGWNVLNPVTAALTEPWQRLTGLLLGTPEADDIKRTVKKVRAAVRRDSNLSTDEISFLIKRLPRVHRALEKALNQDISIRDVPRIAICTSGGGIRAAITTLGLLEGLDAIGLIDGLTYGAALSGSSWIVSNFVELGYPVKQYRNHFITGITEQNYGSVLKMPNLFDNIKYTLRPKYIFGQTCGIVDLCGTGLAHTFYHHLRPGFGPDSVKLSDCQRHLATGSCFFPIYTAIALELNTSYLATFTPYEFSIDELGLHIPIWSFGRRFNNGVSIDYAPEPSLGFCMGIWGSAYAGTFRAFLKRLNKFDSILRLLTDIGLDEGQLVSVTILNPLRGIINSRFRNFEHLTLMDQGYDVNLPLEPLLNKDRKIDLIIVLDASASVHEGAETFKEVINVAEGKGFHFDPIDFKAIAKKPVSLINGKEGTPQIIFMVPTKNQHFDPFFNPEKAFKGDSFHTLKFNYSADEIKKLSGVVRQNIIENKNVIIHAIKSIISKKMEQRHKSAPQIQQEDLAHA